MTYIFLKHIMPIISLESQLSWLNPRIEDIHLEGKGHSNPDLSFTIIYNMDGSDDLIKPAKNKKNKPLFEMNSGYFHKWTLVDRSRTGYIIY